MSLNNFYKCVNRIKYLMKFRDFDKLFGNFSKEAKNTIEMCIKDMEQMASGTKIIGDLRSVNLVTNFLLDKVTRDYISKYVHDFCETCMLLFYNWNLSIENSSNELAAKIRAIDRLVKAHYTLLDAIRVLKDLIRRPYTPAAYELSRHYLEAIREVKNYKTEES